jgi:hypothetical protein
MLHHHDKFSYRKEGCRNGGAVAAVRASEASLSAELAFAFPALTASHPGEVRLATWDEVKADTGERTLSRPAHEVETPTPGAAVRASDGSPERSAASRPE